jgi:hypothetical protein
VVKDVPNGSKLLRTACCGALPLLVASIELQAVSFNSAHVSKYVSGVPVEENEGCFTCPVVELEEGSTALLLFGPIFSL